ncbi:MAG: hypothetical protein K0R98_1675 [Rickettsiaceae bacterium]|nr:hypothetical protein [Rickettsiaceae bacterium]
MSRTKENTPVFTSENESIIQKIVNAFMGELEGYDSIDDKLTRIQELKFDRESKIKNNPNASDVKPLIAEAARRAEENIRTPKKAQTLAASTSAPNLSRRLFESPAPKPDKTLPENNFTASTGKSEQANEVTTLEKLKTIELQLAQIHQSLAQNSHQISVEESGVVDAVIGKLNAIKQLSGKQQATPANIDRDEPRIIGALKTTPIERRVTFTSSENSSPYTGISKSVSQISLSPTPQPFTYSDDVRRRRHSTFINTNIAPSPKLDKESISRAYKKLLNHRLGNHGKDRSPKKDDARINPISAEAFEFKSNMKFLKEALHDSMICLSSIDETKRNELLDQKV